MGFLAGPLGQLLYLIYKFLSFNSYGVAIILFTIIIKLILLPLVIKQQKSTVKMQEIQPEMKRLQDAYKNDKEKLNMELAKLYKESGYNPLSGCLPMVIQLPILFGLYYAIMSPLRYMFNIPQATIDKLTTFIAENPSAVTLPAGSPRMYDINIINYFTANQDKLSAVSDLIKPEQIINLNFLGINLGLLPKFDPNVLFGSQMSIYLPLFLIPILATVTTFLSIKYSTPKTKALQTDTAKKAGADMSGMNNTMLYLMPAITLFFSFSVPAGLGLYWIISSVVQIAQQYYINKYIMKHEHDKDKEKNDQPVKK